MNLQGIDMNRATKARIHRSFAGAWAAALMVAAPAAAQPAARASDVPDRFRIEAGGFRIGSDTSLTFNTSGGSRPPVSFEALNVPENVTRFYIEGFWRLGRRHQVSLSWYDNRRDGDPKTVERDFAWGDRDVKVGTTVSARVSSSYFSGVYRFAVYKNDRFEIGPAVGIGYLSLEAGLAGDASIDHAGGTSSSPFDISRDLNQPTGDLGGYLYWWPIRRLLVRSEARYILVKPENAEASVTDGRAAALYHPWRNIGVGLQYTYTKFRYDRDIVSTELGGRLRYSGGQLVLSGAF
jgi:hypothetical protein